MQVSRIVRFGNFLSCGFLAMGVAIFVYIVYGPQLSVWRYNSFLDELEEPFRSTRIESLPGGVAYLRGVLTSKEAKQLKDKFAIEFGADKAEMLFQFAELEHSDSWNQYTESEIKDLRTKQGQQGVGDRPDTARKVPGDF